jgi:hypothetical protein
MTRIRRVAAACGCYLGVELAAHLLVTRLRVEFPWLIGPGDVAPDIPAELADRHAHRSFDPDLGWCRRPGESGVERTDTGETSYSVDRRGRRHSPGAGDRAAAVACFGDSFVFCRLVDDDQTWPHQLSGLLGVGVANYGVGNYGLDQALLRFERELDSIEARVVVMGVVPETIARVQSYWKHYFEYGNTLAFKPRFTAGPAGLRLHPCAVRSPADYLRYRDRLPEIQRLDGFYRRRFRRDLLRFPYLPRLARRGRRQLPILGHLLWGRVRRDREGAFRRAFQAVLRDNGRSARALYRDPESVRLLHELVLRFATTCRQAGKEPVLLVMPQLVDLDHAGAYGPAYARLRRLLPVVDVTDRFRDAPDRPLLYTHGRLGPHPSALGNRLIAAALAGPVSALLAPPAAGADHRAPVPGRRGRPASSAPAGGPAAPARPGPGPAAAG